MRLRMLVCLVLDKVVYRGHVRKRLHAEFTVEAASDGGEDLVLFLCSMPDYVLLISELS